MVKKDVSYPKQTMFKIKNVLRTTHLQYMASQKLMHEVNHLLACVYIHIEREREYRTRHMLKERFKLIQAQKSPQLLSTKFII